MLVFSRELSVQDLDNSCDGLGNSHMVPMSDSLREYGKMAKNNVPFGFSPPEKTCSFPGVAGFGRTHVVF